MYSILVVKFMEKNSSCSVSLPSSLLSGSSLLSVRAAAMCLSQELSVDLALG